MNPQEALVGTLCALVVVIPLMLWIGGILLRAAVGVTNKVFGGEEPSDLDYYSRSSGYGNGRYAPEPTRSGLAIPVPSSGRAMGIVFLIGVVDFLARCAIMFASGFGSAFAGPMGNGGTEPQMAFLIYIPVSFVIHIAMLSSLLPTTLVRAFFVVLFEILIVVFLIALPLVALFVIAFSRGAMQ